MAEREASAVGRSAQHVVYVLPHATYSVARFLGPALDRVTEDADATQVVVITPDPETALLIADVARAMADRPRSALVPISAARRGARLLASRVVPALAASPSTLVSLLRSSSVKLAAVRVVVIAWADELFETGEEESLEVVLAEIPKDASRIVVTREMTPEVDALVERHLRRASRQGLPTADQAAPSLPIEYVSTSASGRGAALRRLLDELDPPSVIIVANDPASADDARASVAALGYEGDANVRVVTEPVEEPAALTVLYDLPATAADVAAIAAAQPPRVVALVAPRQVTALRRTTAGAVTPLGLSEVPARARSGDERIRAVLRAELEAGIPAREVMAIEPLLAEFDGVEIAAAVLRILERERTEARARRVEAQRRPERTPEGPVERGAEPAADRRPERGSGRARGGDEAGTGFTRVFLSIGERDGVRPGDLVGAITGESGITSDRIGKLDIREGHTVAEIAAADAPTVIEKMNGVTVKGRRVSARVDERPAAPRSRERRDGGRDAGRGFGRDAGRGDRRPSSREGGRGAPRGGGRGGFGDRDTRSPRSGGRFGDSGERRPRRDEGGPRGRGAFRERPEEPRVPRAAREGEEWSGSERADRLRNARRRRPDET